MPDREFDFYDNRQITIPCFNVGRTVGYITKYLVITMNEVNYLDYRPDSMSAAKQAKDEVPMYKLTKEERQERAIKRQMEKYPGMTRETCGDQPSQMGIK